MDDPLEKARIFLRQHRYEEARQLLGSLSSGQAAVLRVKSYLQQGLLGHAQRELDKWKTPHLDEETRRELELYELFLLIHGSRPATAFGRITARAEEIAADQSYSPYLRTFARDIRNRADIARISFGLLSPLQREAVAAKTAEIARAYAGLGHWEDNYSSRLRRANLLLGAPLPKQEKAMAVLQELRDEAVELERWATAGDAELRLGETELRESYQRGSQDLAGYMKRFETAAAFYKKEGRETAEAVAEARLGLLLLEFGIQEGEQIVWQASERLDKERDAVLLNDIWGTLSIYYTRRCDIEGTARANRRREATGQLIGLELIGKVNTLHKADAAFRRGNLAEARELLQQAIEEKDSFSSISSVAILTNLLGALSDRESASHLLEKAVADIVEAGPTIFLSQTYYLLAAQHIDGNPRQALPYLDKCLEVGQALKDTLSEAQHLGMKAWLQARIHHFEKREPIIDEQINGDFNRVIELAQQHRSQEAIEILAGILQYRGQAFFFQKDYEKADFWFEQAEQLAAGFQLLLSQASTLSMRTLMLIELGRKGNKKAYQLASQHIQRSVELFTQAGLEDMLWRAEFHQALTAEEAGRLEEPGSPERAALWDKAADYYEQSANRVEQLRGQVSREEGEVSQRLVTFFGINKQTMLRAGFIFHSHYRGDANQAIRWLERMKGRALMEALQTMDTPKTEQIGSEHRQPAGWAGLRPLLRAAEARLGRRIVIGQYYCGRHFTQLFTMRSDWDEPTFEHIPLDYPLFEGLVQNYFRQPDGVRMMMEDVGEEPWQVFQNLVSPLSLWSKPGDVLCLVPYGILHDLPLHTLPIEESYLFERNPVFYCPSLSVLAHILREEQQASAEPVAAVFGDSAGDLPEARSEAQAIFEQLGGSLHLGPEVDKAKVEAGLQQAAIFHFAGHGHLSATDGFRTGLQLAKGEILTAAELLKVRSTARLAVLSGCETGVSHRMEGDELFGLVHALFYAGVNTLLVSQWRVADALTRRLLATFYWYAYGAERLPYVLALQQAMLEVYKEFPEEGFYHWGAFTLVGAP